MALDDIAVRTLAHQITYQAPYTPGVLRADMHALYRDNLHKETYNDGDPDKIDVFYHSSLSINRHCYRFKSPQTFGFQFDENKFGGFHLISNHRLENLQDNRILILVPGWGEDREKVSIPIANSIYKDLGIPVIMPIPPFQYERTPRNFTSGEAYFHPRVDLSGQNVGHFGAELRSMARYLKDLGHIDIDMAAISAGGFSSTLSLMTTNRYMKINNFINICSGGLLGGIVFDGIITRALKEGLISQGITRSDLIRYLSPYDPLFYDKDSLVFKNNVSGSSVAIVAKNDKFVPSRYQYLLAKHLKSDIVNLHTGHSGLVIEQKKIISTIKNIISE